MEEDEDRLFLSSLGVTSANPEDIERDVLAAAAENDGGNSTETEGSNEEEPIDQSESNDPSSTSQETLYNKLRAVEFEIDAVSSTVDHARRVSSKEDNNIDDGGSTKQVDREDDKSSVQASLNDMTLQHALTADRIKSLEKTKAQLEKELSRFQKEKTSKGIEHDKFIQDLVKEEPKPKRKPKEAQKLGKDRLKRLKTASVDDDFDFDSVLDAASAGFVETKRDELVRKGILTPFHKLKGFERRIHQAGPSNWRNMPEEEEDRSNDLFSASVDRAVRSMSEAAQARPSTKLLDPNFVPKLDGPTRPFQRLKTPFRIHESPESELEKKKGTKRKQKRPLPDKKWRKRISCEDTRLEENGDSRNSLITSSYEEEKLEDVENIDDNEPPFVTLEGGLKIPESIFSNLFDYQKVGVQWLWELHCQRAGGVIGDEMGLGKTIQVISFLGALHFSNMYKPSIVVCPVTLLRQWKREAEKWYPGFHVEILHDSAQHPGCRKKRAKSSDIMFVD